MLNGLLSTMGDINIVVIDTETTGIDVLKDDIVQLAAVLVQLKGNGEFAARTLMLTYCNPKVPIDPEAAEVHGITQEMVQYAPSSKWALIQLAMVLDELGNTGKVILAGHNSERFDIPLMHNLYPAGLFNKYLHIDTYNLALRMFSDAYNKFENPREYKPHKLERMYEWYCGGVSTNAHDAAADCHMAAHLLAKLLHEKGIGPQEAADWLSRAESIPYMPYGKYGGKLWSEVPKGYLGWCRKNWDDTNKDVWVSLMEALGEAA